MEPVPVAVPKMALRDAYSHALVELGKRRPDVVVLDADLALSTKTKRFGTVYPDRFFDVGIAELNLMGVAAGLATAGKTVFASTFATFATGQPYNVIRQSIAYAKLNVKIVATHAGLSVGGDGATHQMLEDLSLMRGLPNMSVFAPADGPEMEACVMAVAEVDGPCYVRCGREDHPILPGSPYPFEVGKANLLKDGSDVTLVATGTMVYETLMAAEALERRGISARVLNMHTVKPLDTDALAKAARETNGFVTAEEHSVYGGLGSAVAEWLVENKPMPMRRIGTRDVFGESGEPKELMAKYGLTGDDVVKAALEVLGK